MSTAGSSPSAGREQDHAGLFAELVVQHANMALIFAGAVPHPQTGEMAPDLEAAQLFINRLDMLQAKTRGNLGAQESALLQQSLAAARMAFVEAVERGTEVAPAAPGPPATDPATPPEPAATAAPESPAPSDEERRKFVKKY